MCSVAYLQRRRSASVIASSTTLRVFSLFSRVAASSQVRGKWIFCLHNLQLIALQAWLKHLNSRSTSGGASINSWNSHLGHCSSSALGKAFRRSSRCCIVANVCMILGSTKRLNCSLEISAVHAPEMSKQIGRHMPEPSKLDEA